MAEIRDFPEVARPVLVAPQHVQPHVGRNAMRRSNTYLGAATFVAIALAMPLAALEPVAGPSGKAAAAACGAKLAALCDRAAA
jgi:hypothetical protein